MIPFRVNHAMYLKPVTYFKWTWFAFSLISFLILHLLIYKTRVSDNKVSVK